MCDSHIINSTPLYSPPSTPRAACSNSGSALGSSLNGVSTSAVVNPFAHPSGPGTVQHRFTTHSVDGVPLREKNRKQQVSTLFHHLQLKGKVNCGSERFSTVMEHRNGGSLPARLLTGGTSAALALFSMLSEAGDVDDKLTGLASKFYKSMETVKANPDDENSIKRAQKKLDAFNASMLKRTGFDSCSESDEQEKKRGDFCKGYLDEYVHLDIIGKLGPVMSEDRLRELEDNPEDCRHHLHSQFDIANDSSITKIMGHVLSHHKTSDKALVFLGLIDALELRAELLSPLTIQDAPWNDDQPDGTGRRPTLDREGPAVAIPSLDSPLAAGGPAIYNSPTYVNNYNPNVTMDLAPLGDMLKPFFETLSASITKVRDLHESLLEATHRTSLPETQQQPGLDNTPTAKPEPVEPGPGKPEPVKPEPVKLGADKPEPVEPGPGKPEPGKPEPAKPEPGKPEPGKPEPLKPEPVKLGSDKPEPVESEPAKLGPVKPRPALKFVISSSAHNRDWSNVVVMKEPTESDDPLLAQTNVVKPGNDGLNDQPDVESRKKPDAPGEPATPDYPLRPPVFLSTGVSARSSSYMADDSLRFRDSGLTEVQLRQRENKVENVRVNSSGSLYNPLSLNNTSKGGRAETPRQSPTPRQDNQPGPAELKPADVTLRTKAPAASRVPGSLPKLNQYGGFQGTSGDIPSVYRKSPKVILTAEGNNVRSVKGKTDYLDPDLLANWQQDAREAEQHRKESSSLNSWGREYGVSTNSTINNTVAPRGPRYEIFGGSSHSNLNPKNSAGTEEKQTASEHISSMSELN